MSEPKPRSPALSPTRAPAIRESRAQAWRWCVAEWGVVRLSAALALLQAAFLALVHGVLMLGAQVFAALPGWSASGLSGQNVAAALALVWLLSLPVCLALARGFEAMRHDLEQMGRHARPRGLSQPMFMQCVAHEWARARRYGFPCALLWMDVDHCRRVNEQHGQAGGDRLLQAIAELTAQSLREPDLMGRMGGETFAVFLPHTDPLGALDVAERLRQGVEHLGFSWQGRAVPVSVSLGVANLASEHVRLDQLLSEAQEALALAKAAGRNCVRMQAGFTSGRSSMVKG